MIGFDEHRIERLIDSATGSLDPASLWLALTSVPERRANMKFDGRSMPQYQGWLRGEAGNWPANLGVGQNRSGPPRDGKLLFLPEPNDGRGPSHLCELHSDGACVLAVQVGSLKPATDPAGKLWAIGEGSIAWLSVCLIRLAAGWAAQGQVLGQGSLDLRLLSSAPPDDRLDLQLWSFASGANAPASDVRRTTQPSRRLADLLSCLAADAPLVARSMLLPLLAQFGHGESRHIDASGVILSENFVGHATAIIAWAKAIGAACR